MIRNDAQLPAQHVAPSLAPSLAPSAIRHLTEIRSALPQSPGCRRPVVTAVAAAAAGLAALAAMPAAAAEARPYTIGIAEYFASDNNMLRLADGQTVGPPYHRADQSTTTQLLAGLDQGIGRQRVHADLSLRDVRYRNNTLFNNQGYTFGAGLDWSTAERVGGSLAATANRSLSSFNSYNIGLLSARNYEDVRGLNASLTVGLVTALGLEFDAGQRSVKNTLDKQALQSRNFEENSGGALLAWQPRAATRVGLGLRHSNGRYPRFQFINGEYVPDRYRIDAVELTAALTPGGASSLDLRLGQSRTRYELNRARSFSGITGSLAWRWQPTAKLRSTVRLTRDTGQNSFAVTVFNNVPGASDYSRIVNSLQLDASYAATSKLSFTGALAFSQNQIVQTISNPLLQLQTSGSDRRFLGSLGLRWAPTRSLLLGCDAGQDVRSASGVLTAALHSSNYACFGQLQFSP